MDFQAKKEGDVTVITLTGRLDAVTTSAYEGKTLALIKDGHVALVVDLEGLAYISSAGLRGLLVTAKQLKTVQGSLCFANINGAVREVFDISGFNSIFSMHDSVAAAVASLA